MACTSSTAWCLARGVLAKPSKWRKMDVGTRRALLEERATRDAMDDLNQEVEDFVREVADQCEDAGFDPMLFLSVLEELETSEPAEYVFERIHQRLEHAVEREQEERHAARTKESINLAEYPASFETARMARRFVALLGPTNSGKTHRRWRRWPKPPAAPTWRRCACWRWKTTSACRRRARGRQPLARSAWSPAKSAAWPRTPPTSPARSRCWIPKRPVEVAVIDEIQMLADRDRGAAWTAAVCGAPASTVYLVGAPEARRAIEALAERLECPLEVHVLKRKAPLTMEPGAVRKIRNLRRGDAVIAFSRRNVLMWRDMITEMGLSVATVYGNLSPEVRRAQAERFREGQADIVVGTDAIAMG
jgi:ATP-dependent RNA helicase SUPV3L1/SUV3